MQEIKFRAWIKSVETMVDVESIDFSEKLITHKNLREDSLVDLEPASQIDPFYLSYFSDIELMQFTGRKDRNGKEIYKGNIVKILYTDWPSCSGCHTTPQDHMNAIAETKVVIWSGNGFYLSHKVDGYAESIDPGRHGFIEVIGNIHEHPELLKS